MQIPDDEIEYRASRAGGPGGQNVNRRATRVEARWNVLESPCLSEEQRRRVLERLASRISQDGILRVVAEEERSQARNKQIAAERLRELVESALRRPKSRRETKPPRSAAESRLRDKKRRSAVKKTRRPPAADDD